MDGWVEGWMVVWLFMWMVVWLLGWMGAWVIFNVRVDGCGHRPNIQSNKQNFKKKKKNKLLTKVFRQINYNGHSRLYLCLEPQVRQKKLVIDSSIAQQEGCDNDSVYWNRSVLAGPGKKKGRASLGLVKIRKDRQRQQLSPLLASQSRSHFFLLQNIAKGFWTLQQRIFPFLWKLIVVGKIRDKILQNNNLFGYLLRDFFARFDKYFEKPDDESRKPIKCCCLVVCLFVCLFVYKIALLFSLLLLLLLRTFSSQQFLWAFSPLPRSPSW